ncbi:MAG: peptidylprolyl isomerase, partial [Pseudomonadota bacterium]|nr:peptidylprolyl isomerase [Pseudomonadota bacterium]
MSSSFQLRHAVALALGFALAACQQETPPAAETSASSTVTTLPVAEEPVVAQTPAEAAAAAAGIEQLTPLPGMEDAVPVLTEKTTINFATTAGDLVIEVYPQAAPNAVARFIELVQTGFYDDTPISRVVPGFVAQFGINWREPHTRWERNHFNDDPTLFALERGTLAFAKAGPNSNSTQVFINYVENNRLAAPQYNFTVFGKVVSGMDVVDKFAEVGEPGMGLDQGALWSNGGEYLDSLD